ncbi:MAG: nuclear transport factor 2 family protein [Chlorobi bacterium]|nr:nuclear transport factor 2 family protein [Chlorobiota bacterium]
MKKLILFALLIIFARLNAQELKNDEASIKEVIQTAYVEGLMNEGNKTKIESGFHPDFTLLGIDKGDNMWKYPIANWKNQQLEKRNKGELPLEGNKKVAIIFETIDISGKAAMAKIQFYVGPKLTYIDYISLYKFESGWKMVSKIFYKVTD